MKRSLCSNCSTTLVPGSSATVRVKSAYILLYFTCLSSDLTTFFSLKDSPCHGHVMVYTCMYCKATKRIPAPPNATTSIPPSSAQHAVEPAVHTVAQRSAENSFISLPPCRKDGRIIHPLPLSARRDAGHVVFRGNERIVEDDDAGLGICFA